MTSIATWQEPAAGPAVPYRLRLLDLPFSSVEWIPPAGDQQAVVDAHECGAQAEGAAEPIELLAFALVDGRWGVLQVQVREYTLSFLQKLRFSPLDLDAYLPIKGQKPCEKC